MQIERRVLTKQYLSNTTQASCVNKSKETVTLYIDPPSFPGHISKLLSETPSITFANDILEASNNVTVTKEAEKYQTGAVIFWDGARHIILPPFPVTDNKVISGKLDTSFLIELLAREYTTGIVLVTWGSYGIGVFDGGNLVASKVGTGYIHKEHKKGGRSQKRFARRTEEQKKDFLRRVSNRAEEILSKHSLDYIFFGGNRLIRRPLWQECRYLESQAHKTSDRVLDIRYADRKTLNNILSEVMKSVIFTF